MKILAFSSIQFPGYFGDAIRLPSYGRALVKKGWEFHLVISGRHVESDAEETIQGMFVHRYAIPDVIRPIFHVRKLWAVAGEPFSACLASEGLKLVKRWDVDVLLGYMPNCWGGYPAAQCQVLTGLPMILDCADLFRLYPSFLQRLCFKVAARFLVVSDLVKAFLTNRCGVPQDRVVLLPNGVDTELFNPQVKGRDLKGEFNVENVVLFVGYVYSLQLVVQAAMKVLKKHPKSLFVVVGNHGLQRWKAQVREAGVERRFLFTGVVPHSKVPRYVAAADICVNMFSGENYFAAAHPVKILEYMACGKPVVATNLPGTAQTVRNGFNGFLYPPGDVEAFAARLDELISNDRLRSRLGDNAWATVKAGYSWEALTERLAAIIEEVKG